MSKYAVVGSDNLFYGFILYKIRLIKTLRPVIKTLVNVCIRKLSYSVERIYINESGNEKVLCNE